MAKTNMITIKWDGEEAEAVLSFSKEYSAAYWALQADLLQDAIALLTDAYNEKLRTFAEDVTADKAREGAM